MQAISEWWNSLQSINQVMMIGTFVFAVCMFLFIFAEMYTGIIMERRIKAENESGETVRKFLRENGVDV